MAVITRGSSAIRFILNSSQLCKGTVFMTIRYNLYNS